MKWLSILAVLLAVQTAPTISVTPESGQPGVSFVVSGTGFEPGERVKVLWDGANLGGTLKVDVDGGFKYRGVVPDGAALGMHTIEAEAVGGGTSGAKTSFTVMSESTSTSSTVTTTTAPPATPTTSSATGSPTTAAQAMATTPARATQSTTTSQSAVDEPPPRESIDQIGPAADTTEPTGVDGEESSTTADRDRATPTAAEDVTPTVGSESRGDPGNAGLIIVMAIIGSAAVATFLLWGRSKRESDDNEVWRPAAHEEIAVLAPLSAADVDKREGAWTRRMMNLAPEDEITDMMALSAGFLGLGRARTGGNDEAAVWNSDDGVSWQNHVTLGSSGVLVAIPWMEGVVVTVSREHGGQMDTFCWHSDDGKDWEQLAHSSRASLPGISFEGGTAMNGTLVAWGRDADSPGVWYSRNGVNWQRSTLLGGFDLITRSGEDLWAFGRDLGERRSLVARSSDGISWDELGRQSRKVFDGASVAALAPFQGGMVVAGTDVAQGIAAIWVSDDGIQWHRVPFEPGPGTSIDHLSVVGDRLIAVGADTGRTRAGRGLPIIWASRDAVSWHQVEVPDLLSGTTINTVLLLEDAVLACGTLADEREGAVAPIPVSLQWVPDGPTDPEPDQYGDPTDLDVEEALVGAVDASAGRP